MKYQMSATFWEEHQWHKGIAAAVEAGLTFEAFSPGCGHAAWIIVYTGGF